MKKRFIFDLDGTMLSGDYSIEHEYFYDVFGNKAVKFNHNIPKYLDQYENSHIKYEKDLLSHFLSKKSGLPFNEDIIDGWIECVGFMKDKYEEDVFEVLDYLKTKGNSLVCLTNWFEKTQRNRLMRSGIIDYLDDLYTGDVLLKPHKEAYYQAMGDYPVEECVFIGDNVEKDYIGPRCLGMESILYDKENKHSDSLVKIKRLNKIMDIY